MPSSYHRWQPPPDFAKVQYEQADRNFFFNNYWLPVTQLFREDRPGAQKVERLLAGLFDPNQSQRPLVVIDLSVEQATQITGSLNALPLFGGNQSQPQSIPLFWNEMIQALVIKRLLEGIRTAAEYAYWTFAKSGGGCHRW